MYQETPCKFWIADTAGNHRGFVVSWRFGFIAYDETGFQLGNFGSLGEAQNAVLNPPDIYRGPFDCEIIIPLEG